MAGKFLNTDMKDTIDSLIQGVKTRLNSPFYTFIDKPPTVVTFYNPNVDMSTLDEGTKQIFSPIGPESGLRFNKINNVFLYGFDKVTLDIDMGEWGAESSPIEGETTLPPNTFIPYQEGYFVINYLGKGFFFRVIGINMDTLENGNNFYKLTYKLDNFDLDIEPQVVEEFDMVASNIGTEYKSVITSKEYNFIDAIQGVSSTLRDYFNALFFKKRVQTYVFIYGDCFFYDPYLIEFIIRNGILNSGSSKNTYISQQVYLPQTFCIEYDRTIFRRLELKNNRIDPKKPYGVLIDDPSSLLTTRMEDYYMIDYKVNLGLLSDPIELFDNDLIQVITEDLVLESGNAKEYYNIIGSYFNGKDITQEMIDSLESIDYSAGVEIFYTIPMIIFILEKYAIDLLKADRNVLA